MFQKHVKRKIKETLREKKHSAKAFNDLFSDYLKSLNVKVDKNLLDKNEEHIEDSVLSVYENHLIIEKIERNTEIRNFSIKFAAIPNTEQRKKFLNIKKTF